MLERIDAANRKFKAMVLLNLDCNLDCSYCYEASFRGEHYMSEATAQLLVDTLVRERMSAGYDVVITFYGGEPLLSLDLIRIISSQLLEAAKLHQVAFSFNLVTNGTLLNRQTAQTLIPLGLAGAKFTLDGPREIHDRQRPYASGSGSFDAIARNIAEIWDIVRVELGGNFYQENYRSFPRLLDELLEYGITPDKLTRLMFTPVTPKAGCAENGAGCACTGDAWLEEALTFLREETMLRGFPANRNTVSACMVELKDNVVVNWDGSLYKCPTFIGWEGLSIGSLAEGIIDYTQSHVIGNWENENCLDCSYLPLCFGGCRFMNLLQKKEIGELDCRREFLDATLETHLLQDIAHPRKPRAPR